MQPWIKRGIPTAVITGGLLMLGTGIASASENVSPDKPASPLDSSPGTPLILGDNSVGVPLDQLASNGGSSDYQVPVKTTASSGHSGYRSGTPLPGSRVTAGGDTRLPDVAGMARHPMAVGQHVSTADARLSGGTGRMTAKASTVSSGRVQATSDTGTISGDLFEVPTTVIPRVVDGAASEVDNASSSTASSYSTATAIGRSATSNVGGTLSKPSGTVAAKPNLAIFGVPAKLTTDATAKAPVISKFSAGTSESVEHLPLGRDAVGLPIAGLPKLPALTQVAGMASPAGALGQLGPARDLVDSLSGVVGRTLPVGQLTGALPVDGLTRHRPVSEQSFSGRFTGRLSSADVVDATRAVKSSTPSVHLPKPAAVQAPTRGTFAAHTPVRMGVDTDQVLTRGQATGSAALAETQGLLDGLFTHRPAR